MRIVCGFIWVVIPGKENAFLLVWGLIAYCQVLGPWRLPLEILEIVNIRQDPGLSLCDYISLHDINFLMVMPDLTPSSPVISSWTREPRQLPSIESSSAYWWVVTEFGDEGGEADEVEPFFYIIDSPLDGLFGNEFKQFGIVHFLKTAWVNWKLLMYSKIYFYFFLVFHSCLVSLVASF